MKKSRLYWEHLREEEFDGAIEESGGLCVMPMGCLEKHGPHLPVGTDIMMASTIAHMAADIEPVCVFPDYVFGDVQGHYRFKGGIVLSPELELRYLSELCAEIARNGFKKIMIYNAHGGNISFLNFFLRTLAHTKKDYSVMYARAPLIAPYPLVELIDKNGREAYPELTDEDIEVLREFVAEGKTLGHAGFGETAYILGAYPELVRMDLSGNESGLSTHAADYLKQSGVHIKDDGWALNYPNSYSGHDPVGCSERIGRCALRVAAEQLAGQIRLIKQDENILKWNLENHTAWKFYGKD